MNYIKHYIRLIERAKNRIVSKGTYMERHHIIPKSIFSSKIVHDTINIFGIKLKYGKENILELLPGEHYIAHLLLVKIFEKLDTNCYERMVYAANFMNSRINNNKSYSFAKKKYAKILSKNRIGKSSGAKGKKWSEERKKIGNLCKGKTYEEIYGKEKADWLKQQRSISSKGKTLEERFGTEKAKKMRKTLSLPKSIESKLKISKTKKGIPITEEHRLKIKKFMSDNSKNPHIDQTLYEFENIYTGEKIKARRWDMKHKYKCNSIHKLIDGRYKVNNGWKFLR